LAGRTKVGVLISGRGSNMLSLAVAAKAADYPAEIVLVLSNKPDAGGLALAEAQGVRALAIDGKAFGKDRQAHERAMDAALRGAGVEVVCLAGYMRLLTPWFVDQWAGRMLNIHPSLLPDFKGLDTHARAIAAGVAEAGCSVHIVTAELDDGPVLGQARVPVLPGDDEATLAARVLEAEHGLYPACLAEFCRTLNPLP
jgi:phosphoribosylglycinamide formyltransferase-1/phosphoribosylamine--glycine ligase/phosphoribosylglycinamide formyltransferase/phosphoribosylformylglycinamidine cyclo-ligase